MGRHGRIDIGTCIAAGIGIGAGEGAFIGEWTRIGMARRCVAEVIGEDLACSTSADIISLAMPASVPNYRYEATGSDLQ